MSADTLSEALLGVRFVGAVCFALDTSGNWAAERPPVGDGEPCLVEGAAHEIAYHFVSAGQCWSGLLDGPPVRLEAGDLVVFPRGDPHILSSRPDVRGGIRFSELCRRAPAEPTEEGTRLVCGFLGADTPLIEPLVAALPAMIIVRTKGERRGVLQSLSDLALLETRSPRSGSGCILLRLSELLFAEAVRGYLDALPSEDTSWIARGGDSSIVRALEKIHRRLAHPWSLDKLAREVGVSRSVLVERFARRMGVPPMHYLTQYRVDVAASLLRSTSASLAEIADRVGYGSETALSRAFKRCTGVAPAAYRRSFGMLQVA